MSSEKAAKPSKDLPCLLCAETSTYTDIQDLYKYDGSNIMVCCRSGVPLAVRRLCTELEFYLYRCYWQNFCLIINSKLKKFIFSIKLLYYVHTYMITFSAVVIVVVGSLLFKYSKIYKCVHCM